MPDGFIVCKTVNYELWVEKAGGSIGKPAPENGKDCRMIQLKRTAVSAGTGY